MKVFKKIRFLLSIIAVIGVAIAAQAEFIKTHTNENKLFLDVTRNGSYLGVIMPSEFLPTIIPQCSRSTPEVVDTWDVTKRDVSLLENEFPRFLKRVGIKIPNGGLNNYYRQYLGIVVIGRKLIYINGYHNSYYTDREKYIRNPQVKKKTLDNLEKNLSEHVPKYILNIMLQNINYWPANVCEGGDRYFGAVYDVSLSTFTELHFSHDMIGSRPGYDNESDPSTGNKSQPPIN